MPNRTPSQRGRASRRKGHNYERRIAAWYREHVKCDAERGYQSRDGTKEPDVMVPGFSIECKCTARTPNIVKAMGQAVDCATDCDVPVVHVKVTNKGEYVVVRLCDWAEIINGKRFVNETQNGFAVCDDA